jgi:hypothetical protein
MSTDYTDYADENGEEEEEAKSPGDMLRSTSTLLLSV